MQPAYSPSTCFYGITKSSRCSQKPTTGLHPQPSESNPQLRTLFISSFQYISISFSAGFSPVLQILQLQFRVHSSSAPRALHAPPICITVAGLLMKQYELLTLSLCNSVQPPVTSSVAGPYILFVTLLANTLYQSVFFFR